jgi:hypothetical protein
MLSFSSIHTGLYALILLAKPHTLGHTASEACGENCSKA